MRTNSSKLTFIAPEPEHGGVGSYTNTLRESLPVESSLHGIHPAEAGIWDALVVLHALMKNQSEPVHVQHAYFGPMGIVSIPLFIGLYFISRLKRFQTVLTVHESWGEEEKRGLLGPFKAIYIAFFHILASLTFTETVFLSETTEQEFVPQWNTTRHRLPHGVPDIEEIDKAVAKNQFGYDENETVVGTAGFVNDRKNHFLVRNLALRFPDTEFLVAGGARTSQFEYLVENLKMFSPENFQVTGTLSSGQFHAAFDAIDVMILPYKDIKQSGILNNCAAHSSVVLASDIPYFETLSEEFGCIRTFPQGDLHSAQKELANLLEDNMTCEKLRQEMNKYADSHSATQVAEKHVSLYRLGGDSK